jgi:hypothetical protein
MGLITLMMEAARTSEILVNFYQAKWRCNPEDSNLGTGASESFACHREVLNTVSHIVKILISN